MRDIWKTEIKPGHVREISTCLMMFSELMSLHAINRPSYHSQCEVKSKVHCLWNYLNHTELPQAFPWPCRGCQSEAGRGLVVRIDIKCLHNHQTQRRYITFVILFVFSLHLSNLFSYLSYLDTVTQRIGGGVGQQMQIEIERWEERKKNWKRRGGISHR